MTHAGCLKLADFGLAREVSQPAGALTPDVVTLWYRPPELLLGAHEQTPGVDIWASACIFGELLVHRPLLPGRSDIHQLALIIDLLGTPNEHIWPQLPHLPVMQKVELRRQPYNNVRSVFKWLNDEGVKLMNALFMYDPSK